MERTGTAVFIAMIAFLSFVGGAMTMLAQAFPYQYLRNAYRAGESLVVQRQLTGDPLGTSMYQPARNDARGVVVHDPDRASNGYTLYTSGDEQVARLIDMDGNQVYEWQLPFSKTWNDQAAVKKPQPDRLVYKERARLLPNGDLLVIYNSPGETPWGYGMARIDLESNLTWSYLEQVHHDLDIAPDGRILTLTHELSSALPEEAPQLDPPYLRDFLVVLSEDGKELQKISLTEPFLRSRYKFLFTTLPYYALADPLHTNSVEYITEEKARNFPFAEVGDVLLSFRDLSLIAVLSMETQELTWAARGPWLQQHGPTLLPDGDILLFDNFGALRDENSSRIVQFDPRTANVTWEYSGDDERPLHSTIRSMVQRLPNGNTLVTEADGGRIFEVAPSGEIVWEFVNPVRKGEQDELIPFLNDGQRIDPASLDPDFRRMLEERQTAQLRS